jgi:hypothetical protein
VLFKKLRNIATISGSDSSQIMYTYQEKKTGLKEKDSFALIYTTTKLSKGIAKAITAIISQSAISPLLL